MHMCSLSVYLEAVISKEYSTRQGEQGSEQGHEMAVPKSLHVRLHYGLGYRRLDRVNIIDAGDSVGNDLWKTLASAQGEQN